MKKISYQDLSPEALELLKRHNLLKTLVHKEIVENTVAQIEINQDEKDKCLNNYKKANNIDSDDQLSRHISSLGLSKAALEWQLELPLRVQRYSQETFNHKAEARFLSKKEELDRIVYSLIRLRDGFLARELYLRIAGNEADFSDLAARYSQGPEAKTKGIIGPVAMNKAHPSLAEKLRTCQPGQLLEPFSIDDWWLVVRLERYESAQFVNSTAQVMAEEMFQEWIIEQVNSKIKQI